VQDTTFMSATEKDLVLRQWEQFLKSGLAREKFTKTLYHHLIQHCSFIAHYNIDGFYAEYFTRGCAKVRFLAQFDDAGGIKTPKSAELGMDFWYTKPEYHDINSAMCEVARKYMGRLMLDAHSSQRSADIDEARDLLARHGLTFETVPEKA
jgi:hypothetical protein